MDDRPEPARVHGGPGAEAAPSVDEPIIEVRLPTAVSVSINICAIVLTVAALYFAKAVMLPMALALLVTLTLSPVVRTLAKRGIAPGLSSPALVLLLASTIGIGAYAMSAPLTTWLQRAPEIGREIQWELRSLRASLAAVEEAGKSVDGIADGGSGEPDVSEVVVREPGFLITASTGLFSAVATAAIAALLSLFLLASGDTIHERVVHALPTFRDKRTAVGIVRGIERSVSRYLFTITVINTGLGITVGTVLWALGMPTPALFGVMATLLNFMPYLGAILGFGIVSAISFVTFDGLTATLAPPLVYLALTSLEGNVVTPLVLGRRLELNAVAILVGVAFMGWLWGAVGVFLAVPILVVLKTICDHLPSWRMLDAFLGADSEPPQR